MICTDADFALSLVTEQSPPSLDSDANMQGMYKSNVRGSSPTVRKRTENTPKKTLNPEHTNIPIPFAGQELSTSGLLKQLEFSAKAITPFFNSRANVEINEKEKENLLQS